MKQLHIITPVKDSIHTTLDTIRSVMASELDLPFSYTVYNDNSTPQTAAILEAEAQKHGLRLIHIADHTSHPSPNYLWVLCHAQQEALANEAGVCIVESDVTIQPHTLQMLVNTARSEADCGIAAAVTVDEGGQINYPYLYAKGRKPEVFATARHCSFCCSLLSPSLLQAFDFAQLNSGKDWFDVTISHQSLSLGLKNYLHTNAPVLHRPHQSRPWKLLKYTHPLKYYWIKFTKGFDKI